MEPRKTLRVPARAISFVLEGPMGKASVEHIPRDRLPEKKFQFVLFRLALDRAASLNAEG